MSIPANYYRLASGFYTFLDPSGNESGPYNWDGATMSLVASGTGGGGSSNGFDGTPADGSGSIAVGNTSQQIFAANAARKYLYVQNPGDATESLFVNFGSAASTSAVNSVELFPGGSITMQRGDFISTGSINVNAVTAGHKFIAKQA